MYYSICSDLYRIEDQNQSSPLCESCEDISIPEEDTFESDDWYGDLYDESYDCEPEVDWDAEYYAANDPSNWD